MKKEYRLEYEIRIREWKWATEKVQEHFTAKNSKAAKAKAKKLLEENREHLSNQWGIRDFVNIRLFQVELEEVLFRYDVK